MFDHLPRPFRPGMVIPSNRDPNGWHFTFVDAEGHEYYYRITDYRSPGLAKMAMRRFVAQSGNAEMRELVADRYGR